MASVSYAVHRSTKLLIARHGAAAGADAAARLALKREKEGDLKGAAHWREVEAAVRRRQGRSEGGAPPRR